MNCPTTGEFCSYLAQFAKVRSLAQERAFTDPEDSQEFFARVSGELSKIIDVTEAMPCDKEEGFCAVLSQAAVGSVVTTSYVENQVLRELRGKL